MEVICIKQPYTMIDTEFIVGKKYSCFKKVSHTTWFDIDGTHRYEEKILDGWYVFDEKNNTVEAISSCFTPVDEYRENIISDILQ